MRHSRGKIDFAAVRLVLAGAALAAMCGCGDYQDVWREQRLPSGKFIKVTALNLVWGAEHDDHALGGDCFSMEFVTAIPGGDSGSREREAVEVFELMRPVSELWGFTSAELAGFPTTTRKGSFEFYVFHREADGKWSEKVEHRKVFAND